MDELGLVSGDNLAFLWFQNKSRCLDAEPLPVTAGGDLDGRKRSTLVEPLTF